MNYQMRKMAAYCRLMKFASIADFIKNWMSPARGYRKLVQKRRESGKPYRWLPRSSGEIWAEASKRRNAQHPGATE